jgi:hypothetical protein
MWLLRYLLVSTFLTTVFLDAPAALAQRECLDDEYCEDGQRGSKERTAPSPPVADTPFVNPTKLLRRLEVCVLLTDPATRLNCYDLATGRRGKGARLQSPAKVIAPVSAEATDAVSPPIPERSRPEPAEQTGPSDPMLECTKLESPAKQLKCFDRVNGRR